MSAIKWGLRQALAFASHVAGHGCQPVTHADDERLDALLEKWDRHAPDVLPLSMDRGERAACRRSSSIKPMRNILSSGGLPVVSHCIRAFSQIARQTMIVQDNASFILKGY